MIASRFLTPTMVVLAASLAACASSGSVPAPDAADLEHRMAVQRATQAAIWAMPAVGIYGFERAMVKDLGGAVNDVVYLSKPLDSRHGFLTANNVTPYALGSLSAAKGPLVVEIPAGTEKLSFFGTFVNQWDQPIEDVGPSGADKGKGGKYLFVPPDYKGKLPKSGYLTYHIDTYAIGFALRPVGKGTVSSAENVAYSKKIKVYPLSCAASPPPTRYLDAYPTNYNNLPVYDVSFFEDVHAVVQNNPIRAQDKVMVGLLRSLGIEKGKPFKPTAAQRKAMKEGISLAYDEMQRFFVTPGLAMVPLWKGKSQWQIWNFAKGQAKAGFPYETDDLVLVDERAGGSYFWITYLPRYLGGGTFYLTTLRDKDGDLLDGTSTYRLNVPKDTPAKDFWSVIAYSMKTKGFIHGAKRVGLSSKRDGKTMKANADGSIDVYFSPTAPAGHESNWIDTGEPFFLLFRVYGPASKDFYKSWTLGDLQKVK